MVEASNPGDAFLYISNGCLSERRYVPGLFKEAMKHYAESRECAKKVGLVEEIEPEIELVPSTPREQKNSKQEIITIKCRGCGKTVQGIGMHHAMVQILRHMYECSPRFKEAVNKLLEEYIVIVRS